eukprot:scaffold15911_cov31-Tisochrysis_lutea.AAC.2
MQEANREAANDALERAKAKKEVGDHAAAIRLTEKSIRLVPTEKAVSFLEFLKKFGPDSEFAKGVARIMQAEDHYAVLDLPHSADDKAIKRAYQLLALKIHPDKNAAEGAQAAFQKLSEAFSTLSDPAAKQQYDLKSRSAWARQHTFSGAQSKPKRATPQYQSAGWQSSSSRDGAGGSGAEASDTPGSKEEMEREIAQLRRALSDARTTIPIVRAQLRERTMELEQVKEKSAHERSQWQDLQRQWHTRHAAAESQLREREQLEGQLRRVARLDKGELENLRVQHSALLRRCADLERQLHSERACIRERLDSSLQEQPLPRSHGSSTLQTDACEGGKSAAQAIASVPLGSSSELGVYGPQQSVPAPMWELVLTPCIADGRVPVRLSFSQGKRSAVMIGRAHGGRDDFGLKDPRISRNHVRVSIGEGLASAGGGMVAIATSVGANAIGVVRNLEAVSGASPVESAAKGEAVELRHGDRLLLLSDESNGSKFEYDVAILVPNAAAHGSGDAPSLTCARPNQGRTAAHSLTTEASSWNTANVGARGPGSGKYCPPPSDQGSDAKHQKISASRTTTFRHCASRVSRWERQWMPPAKAELAKIAERSLVLRLQARGRDIRKMWPWRRASLLSRASRKMTT